MAAVFFATCSVLAFFFLWLLEPRDLPAILGTTTLILAMASIYIAVHE